MSDIPEEAVRTIEESFGDRFVRHAVGEAGPDAREPFASAFPESAEEVELLARLGARYRIPLMARGAGTALYPGEAPQGLAVRFDAMCGVRLPESGEDWVEVEPGITWTALEDRLRAARGVGPRVYPTSTPRSTVGGWLAENGLGVGSCSTVGCSRTSSRWRPCWRGARGCSSKARPSDTSWGPGAARGSW